MCEVWRKCIEHHCRLSLSFVLNIFRCDIYLVTYEHDAHRNGCTIIYCDCYFYTIFTETRVCRKVCKNRVIPLSQSCYTRSESLITCIFAPFSLQMCRIILKLLSWYISWPFVRRKFLSCKIGTVHKWLNINCLWPACCQSVTYGLYSVE